MATIQRPVKEGSVRTYGEKVGLGFVDILASEMDADLDTMYAAWNGGADALGASWVVSGSSLTPVDATKGVALPKNGDLIITVSAGTVKGSIGATGGGAIALGSNYPWSKQNVAAAGWGMILASDNDKLEIIRNAAGAASGAGISSLLTLDSAGNLKVVGDTHTFGIRGEIYCGQYYTDIYANGPAAPSYDFSGNPSWLVRIQQQPGFEGFQLLRRPPNVVGYTALSTTDYQGNLTILGASGVKASGTTWANPSDIRLKKNITPYTAGLPEILALQPVHFEHNGFADTEDGRECWGYLADDVAAVLPECVSKQTKKLANDEEIELDILDTSNISLAVVNAIKELAARVAALEGKEAPA